MARTNVAMADDKTTEADVLRLFLGRRENYEVKGVTHSKGRIYDVAMGDKHYKAVVLVSSFEYYSRRYHIIRSSPDLVVCFTHNTVLPVACLSLAKGNFAQPYDLPEAITNIEQQRKGQTGSRVLLGMYISGMRLAQEMVDALPPTSKRRYIQKARDLSRRRRGRPVGVLPINTRKKASS